MATNLWPNADLESGVSEWTAFNNATASQSSTRAWEQTYSLKVITGTTPNAGVQSDAVTGLTGSTWYCASFYIWCDDAITLRQDIKDQDENLIGGIDHSPAAGEWVRVYKSLQIAADDTGVVVTLYRKTDTTNTNVYIDGFMLETGDTPSEWVNYSAGSETEIDATLGSLTLTGYNATVDAQVDTDIDATLGSLTLTGYNPTVSAGTAIAVEGPASGDGAWDLGAYIYPDAGGGILFLTGFNATVEAGASTSIDATLGSLTLAGYNATVDAQTVTDIDVALGSLTLSGFNPTVSAGTGIVAGLGSMTLSGLKAKVSVGETAGTPDAIVVSYWWFLKGHHRR